MSDAPLQTGDSDRDRTLVDAAWRQMDALQEEAGTDGDLLSPAFVTQAGQDYAMPPSDSFTGYDLVREIHRGGQGVVYQAVQQSTQRKVAIKVLREGPFAGSADKARFEREVQVLGQLQHPSIVTIHDSGSAAGHFYFVMDYIRGQPLDVFVAGGEWSVEDLLRLFKKICDAVHSAHLRGVIHRDLKPSNIRVDEYGEPHVLDFGLAKVAAGDPDDSNRPVAMTMTGQFVGSLPWASPEQVHGPSHRVDVRTDVYSLGVILFHILTGRFPYNVTGNMRDVVDNILTAESPRPSLLRRQINDEVDTIVLKCLGKDPQRRYQSAGEVARDIQRYLTGEPLEAKRDSSWYMLRKSLHRNVVPVTFASLVLVFVFSSLFALAVVYRREARLRQEAERQTAIARSVNAFLNDDLLAAVGPSVALGRDTTLLREILDQTAVQVGDKLGHIPEAEANIRRTLGKTYQDLGEYNFAENELRRAVSILEEATQVDDLKLAEYRATLAVLLRVKGKHSEAQRLHRQVLRVRRDRLGDTHADTASSFNDLGVVMFFQGNQNDAEMCLRDGLAARRRVGDPLAIAESLNNLGELLRTKGQLSRAEQLHREALSIRREELGERHPDVIVSLNNFALVLKTEGNYGEAETHYRRGMAIAMEVYGNGHPEVATTASNLAVLLQERGRPGEAEALFHEALSLRQKAFGRVHPDVGLSLSQLGWFLMNQDRLEEAEPVLRESLNVRRQVFGDRHVSLVTSLDNLGSLLQEKGEYAEAESLLLEALHIRKRVRGANHPATLKTMAALIGLCEAWGELEKVEEYRALVTKHEPSLP